MVNKLYRRGADKERRIMNRARAEGKISFRSAGSHSPIDVITIDKERKIIEFIQCKSNKMPESAKKRLLAEHPELNDKYMCSFKVI